MYIKERERGGGGRVRERGGRKEGGGERERERVTDRQTDRQTDTQRERERERDGHQRAWAKTSRPHWLDCELS